MRDLYFSWSFHRHQWLLYLWTYFFHSMTAIRAILTILAIMAWLNMVLNMVVIDVYGKIRKNVGHQRKRNWKNFSGSKDIAKSKSGLKLGPFSFVFWPRFSTSLKDPLGCSELAEFFLVLIESQMNGISVLLENFEYFLIFWDTLILHSIPWKLLEW